MQQLPLWYTEHTKPHLTGTFFTNTLKPSSKYSLITHTPTDPLMTTYINTSTKSIPTTMHWTSFAAQLPLQIPSRPPPFRSYSTPSPPPPPNLIDLPNTSHTTPTPLPLPPRIPPSNVTYHPKPPALQINSKSSTKINFPKIINSMRELWRTSY